MTYYQLLKKLISFMNPVYLNHCNSKTLIVGSDNLPLNHIDLKEIDGKYYIELANYEVENEVQRTF